MKIIFHFLIFWQVRTPVFSAGHNAFLNQFTMENVLLGVIGCIIFTCLLFFFMTLVKRIFRLRELKVKKHYQSIIDELLFDLLFNHRKPSEISESPEFLKYKDHRLFQQLMIKSLIGLHHNYSGTYRRNLELFYERSGLAAYSLRKLNSTNWAHIVEGIKDLSSLNYIAAYPRIVSLQNHRNNFVRTEVLLGLIKLKGISQVMSFVNSKVYFNDWVQSNILYVVKQHKIPAPDNLAELLKSKNKSILLLAVRLINYYGLAEHYSALSGFYKTTNDPVLKQEIAQLLTRTEQLQ